MDSVNKTLYIPLYGKSLVSKKGIILNDKNAEEIWAKEEFKLKRKSKSKWLAYFLGMRARVFDDWVKERLAKTPNATVICVGCGLDGRALRVNANTFWYDVDFESVILERRKHYAENENYRMIVGDLKRGDFIEKLPKSDSAIVVLEGVSMYVENADLINTLNNLKNYYKSISVLVDCYTPFAVKMSKLKNPVKEVGVSKVFGIENANILEKAEIKLERELSLTPNSLINELKGFERVWFKRLYAGKISKKLYKLYEYKA